ncbi:MAG TPA: hypothetical protein VFE48_18070 [Methylomirabilota bacterium]|nr:hypothetical protein [Methylomirabilota bacterium]
MGRLPEDFRPLCFRVLGSEAGGICGPDGRDGLGHLIDGRVDGDGDRGALDFGLGCSGEGQTAGKEDGDAGQ